jgi:hypothetical protein
MTQLGAHSLNKCKAKAGDLVVERNADASLQTYFCASVWNLLMRAIQSRGGFLYLCLSLLLNHSLICSHETGTTKIWNLFATSIRQYSRAGVCGDVRFLSPILLCLGSTCHTWKRNRETCYISAPLISAPLQTRFNYLVFNLGSAIFSLVSAFCPI